MEFRPKCLTSFGVYILALVLFLIGFGAPYWFYVSTSVPDTKSYSGLWQSCFEAAGRKDCSSIKLDLMPDWFQATAAFMIIALILAVAAGGTRMYVPVSAGLEIAAGACTLIAIIIYGAEMDATYLHFAFGMSVCAGIIFLGNGIALAVIAKSNGCDMSRQLPCESSVGAA